MQLKPRVIRESAKFCTALAMTLLVVHNASAQDEERPRNRFEHDILAETFGFEENSPASVAIADLYQGCPERDCIPSIDKPKYLSAGEADSYMNDDTLVMAIDHKGDRRAWPIRVLDFHEIVNDTIGGDPIAVTWCPLCGSGLAFERTLDGEVIELGVSGVLHDSDLVMYDRKTQSLWQQITGEAIMGPALGKRLQEVPVTMTEWGRWLETHPDTRVLSLDTGFDRDYGDTRRYDAYEQSDRVAFPVANRDLSVHPKAVVHGFTVDEKHLAVMDTSLDEGNLKHVFNGLALTIRRHEDGSVTATDPDGNTHHATRLFWFAWFNFRPDTERI